MRAWWILVPLLVCPLLAQPNPAVAPEADAVAVTTPPLVDGRLDDPAWSRAPEIGPFYLLEGKGARPDATTSVRAVWTADSLYLAWSCAEPLVARMKAGVTEDGGLVYTDDSVEAFFDPEGSGTGFAQLVSNSRGVRFHTRQWATTYNTVWYRTGSGAAPWQVSWTAAAQVGERGWTVEMAIPFAALGGTPASGDTWGANFCRERYAAPELSTWAPLPGDTFLLPERFGRLTFRAGVTSHAPLVTRPTGREPEPLPLIPRPQELKAGKGTARLAAPLPLRAESVAAGTFLAACAPLVGECRVLAPGDPSAEAVVVKVDTGLGLPSEGYLLETSPKVTITGADPLGVRNGLMTLAQLLRRTRDGYEIPKVRIRDWPDCPVRAWHASSPRVDEGEAYRNWIATLCRLKYNAVMLEVDETLQYETHPEVASSRAPTKAQLSEWVAYAKSLGFEVIPQVAVFGHFGWVLDRPGWADLAEEPTPDPRLGRWVANVRDPRYYPLVFDLFGEVIEVFRPRILHIGHDEITFRPIGVHPDLRGVPPDQLLAEEVTRLHDWLADRGLLTMMWGDQLLPDHNGGAPYFTAKAIDAIPNDVIIADWHYDPAERYPSVDWFVEHGFPVLACGWWEPLNMVNLSRQAADSGILGFSGTSWWSISGYRTSPEHQTAFVLAAESSWSRQPTIEALGYQPLGTWRQLAGWDAPAAETRYLPLDLSRWANRGLSDGASRNGWLGLGPDYDLRALPTGMQWWHGVPYRIAAGERQVVALAAAGDPVRSTPDAVRGIPVGVKAKALCFAHLTSAPAQRYGDIYEREPGYPKLLGTYRVIYEDGSSEEVSVRYRQEVTDWNDGLPAAAAPSLWTGRTRAGAWAQVSGYRWENPHPEKTIASLDLRGAGEGLRLVVLAVTAAVD